MSDYDGWSIKDLEKEISGFAACRDACLRGDWGADRRYLAEGYARRVDGLVAALTRLRFPPAFSPTDCAPADQPKVRTPNQERT